MGSFFPSQMEKEARRCVIGPSSRLNDVKEKQEEEEEMVVPGARQDNRTGIMCRGHSSEHI